MYFQENLLESISCTSDNVLATPTQLKLFYLDSGRKHEHLYNYVATFFIRTTLLVSSTHVYFLTSVSSSACALHAEHTAIN